MPGLLALASPAQADLIGHIYWAYIPNPPFYCRQQNGQIQDQQYPLMNQHISPLLGDERGPVILRKKEDQLTFLFLCMGTTKLCIDINQQTWAFVLPPKKNFHTLFRLFPVLSFYENHVNTTKTLEKRQKLTYKWFTD